MRAKAFAAWCYFNQAGRFYLKILGAIIAGGKSTRFGGDKAAALLNGKALIDHVIDGLAPQCDQIVICGRKWLDYDYLPDRPVSDMGPLGGLCAALHFAADHGYDEVITAGCDVLPVPILSAQAPSVVAGHYLFGRWPVQLAGALDLHLSGQNNRSMRHWMAAANAQEIATELPLHNLNTASTFGHYASFLNSSV
jgi:molybdenum cofactor guanylyltransferase